MKVDPLEDPPVFIVHVRLDQLRAGLYLEKVLFNLLEITVQLPYKEGDHREDQRKDASQDKAAVGQVFHILVLRGLK